MKIRILKKNKDDLNVYTVKNSNISYEELEELLNTYDKVIVRRLDWDNEYIRSLPENFGNLEVIDDLNLDKNKLTSLPESFGNLKVGGSLYLGDNELASLPESFGNLEVGGVLSLPFNQLTSLPESFGNLKVGEGLWLQGNPWIIDTNFVNFCEKYKGKLILDDELEKAITIFLKQQKKLEEWEE
jgi:Leucine-rich repeat (LRR) protein